MATGPLHRRLAIPTTNYYLHQAILAGLPMKLTEELADELGIARSQIARWIGASTRRPRMSPRSGEIFCRLVGVIDTLLELYEGNRNGSIRWLTSPLATLAAVRPVDLLATEPGSKAVLQALHSIEHGLPV